VLRPRAITKATPATRRNRQQRVEDPLAGRPRRNNDLFGKEEIPIQSHYGNDNGRTTKRERRPTGDRHLRPRSPASDCRRIPSAPPINNYRDQMNDEDDALAPIDVMRRVRSDPLAALFNRDLRP